MVNMDNKWRCDMMYGLKIDDGHKWLVDLSTGEILAKDNDEEIQNIIRRTNGYTLKMI